MLRLGSDVLAVLVGASGAGKSTWAAATFTQEAIVSSDALRAVVGGSADDLRASDDAFAVLDLVVDRRAARGLPTVVDTLGLDVARRAAWREAARRGGLRPVAVLVPVDVATARERNAARDKVVPVRTLTAMVRRVDALVDAHDWDGDVATAGPLLEEGFAAVLRAVPTRVVPPQLAALRDPPPVSPVAASGVPGGADGAPDDGAGLRVGLHLSRFDVPADELRDRLTAVARAAEEAGFSSLWVMDHFQQIPQVGRAWDPMLESIATVAHLGAVTERVRVGTLVAGISHRPLGVLGQAMATLDVLSGGRLVCGLGVGWYEREHRDLGLRFPPTAERYDLLADALELFPRLWGPGTRPWAGRTVELAATTCYPRPLQEHVPILVGGQGPRRTLPLAGRLADACNLFGEPDEVAAKVAIVREAAIAAGRDPGDVAVTTLGPLLVGRDAADVAELVTRHAARGEAPSRAATRLRAGTAEDHLERLRAFRAAGVDEAIVHLPSLDPDLVVRCTPLLQRCARIGARDERQ